MLRDWGPWGQSQVQSRHTPPPGQEEVDKACSRRLLTTLTTGAVEGVVSQREGAGRADISQGPLQESPQGPADLPYSSCPPSHCSPLRPTTPVPGNSSILDLPTQPASPGPALQGAYTSLPEQLPFSASQREDPPIKRAHVS